jgi:hypothetical protein
VKIGWKTATQASSIQPVSTTKQGTHTHGRAKTKTQLTHNLEAAGEKHNRGCHNRHLSALLACFCLPTTSSHKRVGSRRALLALSPLTRSLWFIRSFIRAFCLYSLPFCHETHSNSRTLCLSPCFRSPSPCFSCCQVGRDRSARECADTATAATPFRQDKPRRAHSAVHGLVGRVKRRQRHERPTKVLMNDQCELCPHYFQCLAIFFF